MSFRIFGIRILITAAACMGAAPASQPVSELETERASEREQARKQVADYTLAVPTAVNRAVMLAVDHGRLTLATTIRPTPAFQRIELTDLPGISVLNVRELSHTSAPAADESPYTPDFFMFTHYDFSDPQWADSLLTVSSTPMNLQLAQDSESPSMTRSISVVETTYAFNNAAPSIRLRVNISDKSRPAPLVNLERVAPDFVSLRRTYPDDCARYVEPILQALHADAGVFSPESKLIWQVFANDVADDPTIDARVASLITRFNADDYHDRESAASELSRLGELAALALMRLDRSKLSPEQASRVNSFLAPYQPVSAEEAARLGNDVNFLLDCLFDRDPEVIKNAVGRLHRKTGIELSINASTPADTRREAIRKLRSDLTLTTQPTR